MAETDPFFSRNFDLIRTLTLIAMGGVMIALFLTFWARTQIEAGLPLGRAVPQIEQGEFDEPDEPKAVAAASVHAR